MESPVTLVCVLPVGSVESIFLICRAENAPANPACIKGYAVNKVVIGDFDAVVNAFCTPSYPYIVACPTANALPIDDPSFAI